ncbi:MAG: adenylosuccinate lyase [Verrucomicrobia bacterium]|nr:adenylosuccinate lyase [Verrucomicrobiota bacterium]
MINDKHYQSPLSARYASKEMSYLFSPHHKFTVWRKLWIALAKAQQICGLPITDAQIKSLLKHVDDVDIAKAEEHERLVRHDVMAHIHAYGEQCPEAKGIIHLGATSCYVTDNGDLLQMREALKLIRNKTIQVIRQLQPFAAQYAHLSCLSYTHFQAAQPTTVGKRACLWLQDFLIDLKDIEHAIEEIHFLGVKGATGTQASFLSLFQGDHHKVKQLETLVAKEMGFNRVLSISGQTYTRKQDIRVAATLASLASSAHKFATDIRLLAHLKEIEEPFAEKQVGSSAMPYKRNPMRSERICGLSRFLISLNENALYTEATQWLERTLDDSANRRLYIPEMFLTADAILNLLCNVTADLVVHPKMIEKHLNEELPFLATEQILMEAVKSGKDRQQVHERLRIHSLDTSKQIKEHGQPNDLFQRIAKDTAIGFTLQQIQELARPEHFIGRSVEQVHSFLNDEVAPVLHRYQEIKPISSPVHV